MTFIRYPHLERFGTPLVENIEFGTCYVFPKLDGTNASVWFEGIHEGQCDSTIMLGSDSRNRPLELDRDNAGFCEYVNKQCTYAGDEDGPLAKFFWHSDNRKYILYGEWLVPHTVKHYREDAWRKFYIFDVLDTETNKFLPYEVYQPLLERFQLDYIPCTKIIKNGSWENFLREAKESRFLLPENKLGEGVVIKNYDWVNKFNSQIWAKLVNAEFKDDFHKAMGAPVLDNQTNAQKIVENAVTQALVDKEYAKIVNEVGEWKSHYIPRLLHTVFYSVVTEELWNNLKKISYGLVNFKELQQLTFQRVKQLKSELF